MVRERIEVGNRRRLVCHASRKPARSTVGGEAALLNESSQRSLHLCGSTNDWKASEHGLCVASACSRKPVQRPAKGWRIGRQSCAGHSSIRKLVICEKGWASRDGLYCKRVRSTEGSRRIPKAAMRASD